MISSLESRQDSPEGVLEGFQKLNFGSHPVQVGALKPVRSLKGSVFLSLHIWVTGGWGYPIGIAIGITGNCDVGATS